MNITAISKQLPSTASSVYEVIMLIDDGVTEEIVKKIIVTENNDAEQIAIDSHKKAIGLLPADPIPTPTYQELRQKLYAPYGEQLGMIYDDMINGTTKFKDHNIAVKLAIPKT